MKHTIYLFLPIILLSCEAKNTENCHKIITFVNKTNTKLYVTSSYQYPNFDSYKSEPSPLLDPNFSKVEPHEINSRILSDTNCLETTYSTEIPSGKIMVYVFDAHTIETQGWDYIKTNNLVLKRYDITLQDFRASDWKITYDGN